MGLHKASHPNIPVNYWAVVVREPPRSAATERKEFGGGLLGPLELLELALGACPGR